MQDSRKKSAEDLWNEFSDTGKIGAYIMYKSVLAAENAERNKKT